MKQLEAKIRIDASPEKIWAILTDLEHYAEWNPFIKTACGKVAEGERLTVRISPPGEKEMTFKPTVLSVKTGVEFRWLGHFLLPGIFDGEHSFVIKSDNSGSLFIQKETFSGLLVPLVWSGMEEKTREGFGRMNRALKERAENGG